MARKRGFKYPRLTLLSAILIITFFAFSYEGRVIHDIVTPLGTLGAFLAGFLYAFSFTAFAATGILLHISDGQNIVLLSIIAGIGSLIGDTIILKFAKISFDNEFRDLYKEKIFKNLTKPIPRPLQHFLKVVIAMLIIASPLPDEAGVTLLSNGYRLPNFVFAILSFMLNTGGIFLILYAGKML